MSSMASGNSEVPAATSVGAEQNVKREVSSPQSPRKTRSLKRSREPSESLPDQRAADDGPPDAASSSRNSPHRTAESQETPAETLLERVRRWQAPRPSHNPGGLNPGPGHRFAFVSYNVLSQHLFRVHPEPYTGVDPAEAAWEARGPRIWQQITQLSPDIVCLQEVDEAQVDTFWRPRCEKHGYGLVYKRKTGWDKVDGCALLYRTASFHLEEVATVEYKQLCCDTLDRDNVGLVARLRSVWGAGELVVASTHLLYNPRRHDVKLAQMALLLAEVDRLAWCGLRRLYLPVLLAGDFNFEPYTPVYEFLVRGRLTYAGVSRRNLLPHGAGARLGPVLISPQLGVTHRCQHRGVLLRRASSLPESESERRSAERRVVALAHSERPAAPVLPSGGPIQNLLPTELLERLETGGTGALSHGFRLRSVHPHLPAGNHRAEVTTHQKQWCTVDYIFHSVPCFGTEPCLQLLSRLALPTAEICSRLSPYPSRAVPSDHLPLAARFQLCPGPNTHQHFTW